MPRYPDVNPSTAAITETLFSELARQLAQHRGEIYPFYVGETWLDPANQLLLSTLSLDVDPDLYHYPLTYGRQDLLELLSKRLNRRLKIEKTPEHLLVSAGGIGALTSISGAILSPGDEVIILGPYWPLITGIVQLFGASPVVIPFWGLVESGADAVAAIGRAITNRTVCIYINNPNNPTGRVFPEPWLQSIIDLARSRSLWVVSDEAYEDFAYALPHTYAYPMAPERVFAVYSFSKAFGIPGNRCGYAIGPREQIRIARKVNTHISYGSPMASQLAARNLLRADEGELWVANARKTYECVGTEAAKRLGVPPPEGAHYLFIDIADSLDAPDLVPFLKKCTSQGVLVTPGAFFGDYPTSIRICFTCSPPDTVMRGIEILGRILGR